MISSANFLLSQKLKITNAFAPCNWQAAKDFRTQVRSRRPVWSTIARPCADSIYHSNALGWSTILYSCMCLSRAGLCPTPKLNRFKLFASIRSLTGASRGSTVKVAPYPFLSPGNAAYTMATSQMLESQNMICRCRSALVVFFHGAVILHVPTTWIADLGVRFFNRPGMSPMEDGRIAAS